MSELLRPILRFKQDDGSDFPDWVMATIKDCAECLDGKRKPLNEQERNMIKGNIPYYGANGIVGYVNDFIFNEELILLAEDGGNFSEYFDKPIAQFISGKSWVNNHAHVLKAKKSTINKFLFYSLAHKNIMAYIVGGGRAKLNQSSLLQIKINLPSTSEQNKIASFLSSVDKKIELLTKKHELLEKYKKGLMQKIFSQQIRFKQDDGSDFPDWEERRLGGVAKIKTGKSNREDSGLEGKYSFFDRSVDIVRTSNIYLFDEEAIIVAGEGSSFPPKYFKGKFDLHQRAYAIMRLVEVDLKFIFYFIDKNKNYLLRYAVGSTVKSLRLPIFQKMPINLPSSKEQQKIASFLSALDKKIELIQQQIEKTQTFKKGLLQQMFV